MPKVPEDHKTSSREESVVEFNNTRFTLPPAREIPIQFLEYVDDEKITKALRVLLGDDQYELLKEVTSGISDLEDFFEAIAPKLTK